MANKWDGYKNVYQLNQQELDDLKCYFFDTNMPDEYSNDELYLVADGNMYCCEDFSCNCD